MHWAYVSRAFFTGFADVFSLVGQSGPDTELADKLSALLPHTQTRQDHGGYYFLFSLLTQAQPCLSAR